MPDAAHAHDVEAAELVAHGVRIVSRHSKARELRDLLAFADHTAMNHLAHVVRAATYTREADGVSVATIEVDAAAHPVELDRIRAEATITLATWRLAGEPRRPGLRHEIAARLLARAMAHGPRACDPADPAALAAFAADMSGRPYPMDEGSELLTRVLRRIEDGGKDAAKRGGETGVEAVTRAP
jgi:hypothetical protein